jgi:hypothetical protein
MKLLREITTKDDGITDTRSWKKVSGPMGSNPGGVFADHAGEQYYVKHSHTDDHAHNEILANRMYEHIGVPTMSPELIHHSKGLGVASKLTHLDNMNPHDPKDVKDVQKHFAAHAFLSNWDAVGAEDDNQAHTHKGMTTVDAGGALKYRAMGGPKGPAFGHKVSEWDTLRNPEMNYTSGRVFGKMQPKDMVESSKAVANFKNSDIHDIVHKHGGGNHGEKTELVDKMINRKKDIIGRANELAGQHGLKPIKDIDD